jgi:predicted amidophosphoribosyltransferase
MRGDRPWHAFLDRWCGITAMHLLPARCFGCGRSLRRHHLGACPSCWAALLPITGACCARCAILLGASPPAGRLCLRCAIRPFPLDEAVAAVAYQGTAPRFLLRAKERGRPELFRPLAAQLFAAASVSGLLRRSDVVVPVPSSFPSRVRRGFMPAHELARILAR